MNFMGFIGHVWCQNNQKDVINIYIYSGKRSVLVSGLQAPLFWPYERRRHCPPNGSLVPNFPINIPFNPDPIGVPTLFQAALLHGF